MNIFPFILCLLLLFFSQLFVRPPQTAILYFSIFFFLRDGFSHHLLHSVLNICPWFFRHSTRSNLLNILRSYLNDLVVFRTFLSLSLNFAIRSSWSEPQSALSLVFADWMEHLHFCLQRILSIDFGIDHLVHSFLGLLEEGVCYAQCILLAELC